MSALEARWTWNSARQDNEIGIFFGKVLIDLIDPNAWDVKPSQASHGDDSRDYESEDKRVLDEAAAAWLRHHLAVGLD